ncbi:hypothetical protein LINPERPRIM_LOCUS26051, partial [Linum perenne]
VGSSFFVNLGYASALTGTSKDISQYNWGQHVVDTVIDGLVELKSGQRGTYPTGDYNVVVIHLLDMTVLENLRAEEQPTCSFWIEANIEAAKEQL